jgi:hypothetical protein
VRSAEISVGCVSASLSDQTLSAPSLTRAKRDHVQGMARIARAKPWLAGRLHRAVGTQCHHL